MHVAREFPVAQKLLVNMTEAAEFEISHDFML
jgi:hypothetical protein